MGNLSSTFTHVVLFDWHGRMYSAILMDVDTQTIRLSKKKKKEEWINERNVLSCQYSSDQVCTLAGDCDDGEMAQVQKKKQQKRVKEKKGKGNKSVMWWARFSSVPTVLSIAPGRPAALLWLTASRWPLNGDVSPAADHTHVDANDERARWCGYPRWSLVLWVKDARWGASTRASVYPAAQWGFGLTMPFLYEGNEERKERRAGEHGGLFGSWDGYSGDLVMPCKIWSYCQNEQEGVERIKSEG